MMTKILYSRKMEEEASRLGVNPSLPEGGLVYAFPDEWDDTGQKVAHIRAITPAGNVIAMGIAVRDITESGEVRWFGNGLTAAEVEEIDKGGQRGCLWVK